MNAPAQPQISSATTTRELYGIVSEELAAGKYDKGIWLQSLASTNGNEQQAQALYAKKRVAELSKNVKERERNNSLKGVGGWLKAYCIWLEVIQPGRVFFAAMGLNSAMRKLDSGGIAILLFSILCELGYAFYGRVVSKSIRDFDLVALERNQRFLLAGVCINLVIGLIVGLYRFDASKTAQAMIEPLVSKGLGVLFLVVWLIYFKKSKRVYNTFGDNA